MPSTLDDEIRRALAARVHFYHDLGIYDLYRRPYSTDPVESQPEKRQEMSMRSEEGLSVPARPVDGIADAARALRMIREDLGDCTRCRLHQQGR